MQTKAAALFLKHCRGARLKQKKREKKKRFE